MKKQIFNKSLPFANFLILTLVSNVNAGNYLFHTVIDASALAVGNALTGARFSHDAGLTNPARINQFKPGTFLCSSESRFSGPLNRQIFAYQSLSSPFKFLFILCSIFLTLVVSFALTKKKARRIYFVRAF